MPLEISAGDEIIITDGRHPVVECFVSDSYFVPNDTKLDCRDNRLALITGPNMAGKSTYMRQGRADRADGTDRLIRSGKIREDRNR